MHPMAQLPGIQSSEQINYKQPRFVEVKTKSNLILSKMLLHILKQIEKMV